MKSKCILRSLGNYLPVELPDLRPTIIGRSPTTTIKSHSVSRCQLEITPNCEKRSALVKQLGPNDSGINENRIKQGLKCTIKDGDVIHLLVDTGEFDYRLSFEELGKDFGVGDTKTTGDDLTTESSDSKPVKIPKMFQTKAARKEVLARGTWESIDAGKVLVYSTDPAVREPKTIVYAFDLDGTIITTKSGKKFPKDANDWKFLFDPCLTKMQKLAKGSNSKLIIISNQAGLKNGAVEVDGFKRKIEVIMGQIASPLIVFIITGKSEYRKPLPSVWSLFVRMFNGKVSPDMSESLYCGDAAGRKKDHSKSDRLFALNIGIRFLTPEEFFLGQKPQEFQMPGFDPKKILKQLESSSPPSNDHIKFSDTQEVIIMVGYPASGKSEFVRSALLPKGYVHVNRDTLKTAAKCKALTSTSLEAGKSIVIDNTNPSTKDREEYLKLASKLKATCRCFVMKVDYEHALHNNKFRELILSDHEKVPEVAFNTFRSKFEEPSLKEGFTEIVHVNFVPKFESADRKKLYSLYLLEK